MTTYWKQIAIGVALVAGIAAVGYFAWPGRLMAASGGMGSMMNGGMMNGGMGSMMQGGMLQGGMMQGGKMQGMMSGGMGQMHNAMSSMHDKQLKAAADALGITSEELTTAIQAGRGVADLAKERNVEIARVSDSVTAARKVALDDLVSAGTITREAADQMLEHMEKDGFMGLHAGAMMKDCPGMAAKDI